MAASSLPDSQRKSGKLAAISRSYKAVQLRPAFPERLAPPTPSHSRPGFLDSRHKLPKNVTIQSPDTHPPVPRPRSP